MPALSEGLIPTQDPSCFHHALSMDTGRGAGIPACAGKGTRLPQPFHGFAMTHRLCHAGSRKGRLKHPAGGQMPLRGAQRFIPPLAKGAKGDFAIPMKIGIQILSYQLAATKGGRSIPLIVIAKLRSNCGNLVLHAGSHKGWLKHPAGSVVSII